MNPSLFALTLCQGLFLTNNVAFIAINGLVGLALAPLPWMATLPIMCYVLGGALAAPLVGHTQKRWGRKVAFLLGLGVAFFSCLLAAWALHIHSFSLLCVATIVAGYYNANAQLYRFAAGELVAPAMRDKAVSWVLAGGLLGAFLGPELSKLTQNMVGGVPFLATYLALAFLALLTMPLLASIRFAPTAFGPAKLASGRPLQEIVRQPLFIVSTLCSALGYGVMSLLMAATPLAMQVCGLGFDSAATVIQWHVVGMFAPGFFTGSLIRRWGAIPVLWMGLGLNAACVAVALGGLDFEHFLVALFLLGVGWNFLFTASTSLLMGCYRPEEKDKTQSANNVGVFSAQAAAALFSGVLVSTQGWVRLNQGSLILLLCMAVGIVYLLLHRQKIA